jgi:hypothetical protein
MQRGYIRIWRKFENWEWFSYGSMAKFFIWLLLRATHKDTRFQGIELKRGQMVFGRKKASIATGISERSIRTLIKCLKSTNEITIETTNQFSIITLCNFNTYQQDYQKNDQPNDQRTTNERPASDHIQTHKNIKNIYMPIQTTQITLPPNSPANPPSNRFQKPTEIEVKEYMVGIGMSGSDAGQFVDHYEGKGWLIGKSPMKNWQATVRTWKRNKDGPVSAEIKKVRLSL